MTQRYRAPSFSQPDPTNVGVAGMGYSQPSSETSFDQLKQATQMLVGYWPDVYQELSKYSPSTQQALVAIGALHDFGVFGDVETNNWIPSASPPPCGDNYKLIDSLLPPSCIQVFTPADGVVYFLTSIKYAGLFEYLNSVASSPGGDVDVLASMLYVIPQLSGRDANLPLTKQGFTDFRDLLFSKIKTVADSNGQQLVWASTGYTPDFGDTPTGGASIPQQMPASNDERIYLGAYLAGTYWPADRLPVKSKEEGERLLQAVTALAFALSNFGQVGSKETNNWWQTGALTDNAASCSSSPDVERMFNANLKRCIFVLPTAADGAKYALDGLVVSPQSRDAIYTGDPGKLALALINDGFLLPVPKSKDAWAALTFNLANKLNEVAKVMGIPSRWTATDFIPTEFQGSVQAPPTCPTGYSFDTTTKQCQPTAETPPACQPGQVYDPVAKGCVKKPTDGIAAEKTEEGLPWGKILVGTALLGGLGWGGKMYLDKEKEQKALRGG